MSLETAAYPSELQTAQPGAGDPVSQGYAHLNLIKGVIKNTFPNIDDQITASPEDLNNPLLSTDRPPVPAVFADQVTTVAYYTSNTTAGTFPITEFGRDLVNMANADVLKDTIDLDDYLKVSGGTMTGTLETPRVSLTGNGTSTTNGFTFYVDANGRPVVQFSAGNAVVFDAGKMSFVISGATVATISANGVTTTANLTSGATVL